MKYSTKYFPTKYNAIGKTIRKLIIIYPTLDPIWFSFLPDCTIKKIVEIKVAIMRTINILFHINLYYIFVSKVKNKITHYYKHMAGGLMQLVAYGAQDLYLTGNPQITFFKVV